MKGAILITCSSCKHDRLVNTNGMLKSSYEKKHPECHKCGFNNKSKITSFYKGHIPWNNGTKGLITAWNKGIRGLHLSSSSEFKKGDNIGLVNVNWRGNKVGYFNLHTWIYRHKGKAKKCSRCGSTKIIDWANISQQYKRDFNDFIELCRKCHTRYDRGLISL